MRVIGIGCRRGAPAGDIVRAVHAAGATHGLAALDLIATMPIKSAEPGLIQAADVLGLPLIVVDPEEAAWTGPFMHTRSTRSEAIAGVASVAETAALAAAGRTARLLGPRQVFHGIACAIAVRREGG
jgi:cobalt-precorrin 5A hydrolase